MNKEMIIRKSQEVDKIIKFGKKSISKFFVIYFKKNDLKHNKYCISVGKKLLKANKRNLLKRRIKDILMKNNLNYSIDCVIIVRKPLVTLSYDDIKKELINQIKEIKNEEL